MVKTNAPLRERPEFTGGGVWGGGPWIFKGTTYFLTADQGGPKTFWPVPRGDQEMFSPPQRGGGIFCITHDKYFFPKRAKNTFLHVLEGFSPSCVL